MDLKTLEKLATSEVIFAILFIGGLLFIGRWFLNYMAEQKRENIEREAQLLEIYKDQLSQSAVREKELMQHMGENTVQLKSIADTLKGVQDNLFKLEDRVNSDLQGVWKELGSKVDKGDLAKRNGGDYQ